MRPSIMRHRTVALAIAASSVLVLPSLASAQLLRQYTFDIDARDAIGSANGTLLGGASVSNGRLQLNGTSAYVQFATSIVPTSGSFSVAFFARRTAASSGFTEIISQGFSGGPGFFIGTAPDGTLRVTDSWINTGVSAPAVGVMTHYALTVDALGSVSRLYLDGVQVASRTGTLNTTTSGTATRFGRQFDPLAEYFQGEMDDVRIYGNALSAAEVAGLAQTTAPEPSTALLLVAGLGGVYVVRRRRAGLAARPGAGR